MKTPKSLDSKEALPIVNSGRAIEIYMQSDHTYIVLPISTILWGEKAYLCSRYKEVANINARYIDNYFLFKTGSRIQGDLEKAPSILIYNDYEKIKIPKEHGQSWTKTFKPARVRSENDETGNTKS